RLAQYLVYYETLTESYRREDGYGAETLTKLRIQKSLLESLDDYVQATTHLIGLVLIQFEGASDLDRLHRQLVLALAAKATLDKQDILKGLIVPRVLGILHKKLEAAKNDEKATAALNEMIKTLDAFVAQPTPAPQPAAPAPTAQ